MEKTFKLKIYKDTHITMEGKRKVSERNATTFELPVGKVSFKEFMDKYNFSDDLIKYLYENDLMNAKSKEEYELQLLNELEQKDRRGLGGLGKYTSKSKVSKAVSGLETARKDLDKAQSFLHSVKLEPVNPVDGWDVKALSKIAAALSLLIKANSSMTTAMQASAVGAVYL